MTQINYTTPRFQPHNRRYGLQRTLNDEIRDNIVRMRRAWEAERNALATVRRFNATLSAKGYAWFWPKIAAALTAASVAGDRMRQLRDCDRSRFAGEAA